MRVVVALAALVLAGSAAAAPNGADLYAQKCVSCHGVGALGRAELGPPLRGVGALAADFYLRTGYMPLQNEHDQPKRRKPKLTDEQIDALVRYVASFGGPAVPDVHPERGRVSEGMRLFTEHCSGCHQIAGAGGIMPGAIAPSLEHATPVQIAEAVRIGPYLMPRFSEEQISERELNSIIRYVQLTQDPDDRGGWGLGHLGPVPEGIVAWLLAGAALVLVATVIGSRVRREG
jgi:ubiquinol-cytochrome c reductase cytochrome c subunit